MSIELSPASRRDIRRTRQASVLYQYVVGGTTYLSDTVSLSVMEVSGNLQRAREIVSRHPVGSEVRAARSASGWSE